MKQAFRGLGIFLLACNTLLANAMPPKPEACPTLTNIKAAGLPYAQEENGSYTAYQISAYTTSDHWLFGIVGINANSIQEALKIGNKALSTLSGHPEPMAIESEKLWACFYTNNLGLFSVAITPLTTTTSIKTIFKINRK